MNGIIKVAIEFAALMNHTTVAEEAERLKCDHGKDSKELRLLYIGSGEENSER